MRNLRTELKNSQPYFIERDLIDKLYFKEDEKNSEYWIFFYSFIRGLSDEAIGIRLGNYDRYQIYRRTIKILETNKCLIEEFLSNPIVKRSK